MYYYSKLSGCVLGGDDDGGDDNDDDDDGVVSMTLAVVLVVTLVMSIMTLVTIWSNMTANVTGTMMPPFGIIISTRQVARDWIRRCDCVCACVRVRGGRRHFWGS